MMIGSPMGGLNRESLSSRIVRSDVKFSTIARNFSASLHDVFAIDNTLDGLTQSVEQKYVSQSTHPTSAYILK